MRRILWVALVLGLGTASCSMPGDTLGVYTVTGNVTANTCGTGPQAPDPWTFRVMLSKTPDKLYWNTMDGAPLLSGALTGSSMSTTSTSTANVDATDAGPGACTMTRTDALDLTLGDGASPSGFTGTLSYTFTATSDSTCSDQLSASGGMYDALPCTITYDLSGAR